MREENDHKNTDLFTYRQKIQNFTCDKTLIIEEASAASFLTSACTAVPIVSVGSELSAHEDIVLSMSSYM